MVPTAVPFALFSATVKGPPETVGVSFTSVRLMVTVALPESIGEPLSSACTTSVKEVVAS